MIALASLIDGAMGVPQDVWQSRILHEPASTFKNGGAALVDALQDMLALIAEKPGLAGFVAGAIAKEVVLPW